MASSPYSLEQRFEFITDCYKSDLSIPCWCNEHNIIPSTFYGWINHVTNHGYELPDSLNYLISTISTYKFFRLKIIQFNLSHRKRAKHLIICCFFLRVLLSAATSMPSASISSGVLSSSILKAAVMHTMKL